MKKLAMALLSASGVGVLFLASGVVLGQDQAPKGFHYWSKGQIIDMSNALSSQLDATKLGLKTLATEGNQRFLLVHREGPGQAEYHATESDIMFIESGHAILIYGGKMDGVAALDKHDVRHAILIYGGKMVDPKETAPNELRASGIEGGAEKPLAAGDVIAIPPKLPHQVKPKPGAVFNYFVVKVKAAE